MANLDGSFWRFDRPIEAASAIVFSASELTFKAFAGMDALISHPFMKLCFKIKF